MLGRWAFAELTEIYQINADFKAKVDSQFDAMIVRAAGVSPAIFCLTVFGVCTRHVPAAPRGCRPSGPQERVDAPSGAPLAKKRGPACNRPSLRLAGGRKIRV